ncbi:MAG TPA: YfiR family protein [Bacteroidales bacterium]|nr:YfiR family protein [Bacteroidales bacterium]
MKKVVLVMMFAGFMGLISNAQTGIPKAQAMFIYNFSRLIEWPVSYKTGSFVIGILGVGEIITELEAYTAGKKVGTQEIVVKQYKEPGEVDKCHILFVTFAKTKIMADLLNSLGNKSTLIITEKNGAADEGSAINFLVVGDKLKFEINEGNATKYGIKYSAKLTEMAFKSN